MRHISNSIRFSNLDESVTTMFPLIQPTIEDIAEQVYDSQSLDNIQLSEDSPYTSQIIVNAIDEALKKSRNYQVVAAFYMFFIMIPILLRSDIFHPLRQHPYCQKASGFPFIPKWKSKARSKFWNAFISTTNIFRINLVLTTQKRESAHPADSLFRAPFYSSFPPCSSWVSHFFRS